MYIYISEMTSSARYISAPTILQHPSTTWILSAQYEIQNELLTHFALLLFCAH